MRDRRQDVVIVHVEITEFEVRELGARARERFVKRGGNCLAGRTCESIGKNQPAEMRTFARAGQDGLRISGTT